MFIIGKIISDGETDSLYPIISHLLLHAQGQKLAES